MLEGIQIMGNTEREQVVGLRVPTADDLSVLVNNISNLLG